MLKRNVIRRIIAVLLAMMALTASTALAAPLTGSRVKDFTIKTIDGETYRLYELLEEKKLVIFDLWFVDCPSCPNSLKTLQRAAEKYGDSIAVFGLNVVKSDKDDEIREFAGRHELTIPLARDPGVAGTVHSKTYPHAVVVLRGGILLYSDMLFDPETAIECGLMMTDQDIQDLAEWNGTYRSEKEEPYQIAGRFDGAREAEVSGEEAKRLHVDSQTSNYAGEQELKIELEGDDVRRIIVDDHLSKLQAWQGTGAFFLIKHKRHTLRLAFGKGTRTKDLWTDGLPELEKAEKDGNTYVFQNLRPEAYGRYKIWFENGGSREAGFMTFLNEKEAAHYFEVMEKVSGYTFPWHVEEKPAE